MSNEKLNFVTDGVGFLVKKPTALQTNEAQKHYNKTFGEALKSGAVLRAALDRHLRQQSVWDDSKEDEFNRLNVEIRNAITLLLKGDMSVDNGKKIALEIKELRLKSRTLNSARLDSDVSTAEGQSDQARLNYLCSTCIYDKDSEQSYFKDYDDFINRISEKGVTEAVGKFVSLLYDFDDDFEKQLPENQFLRKYKFVNDDLHLINSDGKLVDEDDRLVNDKGRYINEEGQYTDLDGNLLDENGNYNLESVHFTE